MKATRSEIFKSNPPSGWSAFSKFHCGLPNWDRTNQHQCAKNLSDNNQRNMDTNLHEWFGVSTKNSNLWYRGISVGVGVISFSIPPLLAALTPNNKTQQRDVAAFLSQPISAANSSTPLSKHVVLDEECRIKGLGVLLKKCLLLLLLLVFFVSLFDFVCLFFCLAARPKVGWT